MGVLVAGVRQRNPGAVVNAVVGLVGTALPDCFERWYGVSFRPWQRLYVESAMLTHAYGMLGPYDDIWWWDHLTHTHSATLLGGLVHAVARGRGRNPRPRVLGSIVVLGVLWELLEYAIHGLSRRTGHEPLLVPYGREDTLLDLTFNLLGALLVVAFGDRLLGNLVRKDGAP